MVSTAAQSERLYEEALRRGQVRHALKTALGCCLATALSFFFHLPSGQLAPVFAYLLMTLGMPSPRLNWLVSQLAIVVSARVAAVYVRLEDQCRDAARRLRSGESAPVEDSPGEWAPFRPLRQLLAPELRRGRDTANPFARMILACRSLNLRLWFFSRVIAPLAPAALPAEVRLRMARLLDRCAEQLHVLLDGILRREPVLPVDTDLVEEADSVRLDAGLHRGEGDILLVHGIHRSILHRFIRGIQTLTRCHNALLANLRAGLGGELVALGAFPSGRRLVDVNSVRAGVKLVLMILLLLVEEGLLGFPGSSQVAFFATFFASTGNLGRQNKTDLVGLAGLLCGFAYGVVAAFLTRRVPQFPLLLSLVFLGQFLANLAFQTLPRYGVAGMQAGLALPFAYLATAGPEWGSFTAVRTRFAGLVVARFTAGGI